MGKHKAIMMQGVQSNVAEHKNRIWGWLARQHTLKEAQPRRRLARNLKLVGTLAIDDRHVKGDFQSRQAHSEAARGPDTELCSVRVGSANDIDVIGLGIETTKIKNEKLRSTCQQACVSGPGSRQCSGQGVTQWRALYGGQDFPRHRFDGKPGGGPQLDTRRGGDPRSGGNRRLNSFNTIHKGFKDDGANSSMLGPDTDCRGHENKTSRGWSSCAEVTTPSWGVGPNQGGASRPRTSSKANAGMHRTSGTQGTRAGRGCAQQVANQAGLPKGYILASQHVHLHIARTSVSCSRATVDILGRGAHAQGLTSHLSRLQLRSLSRMFTEGIFFCEISKCRSRPNQSSSKWR